MSLIHWWPLNGDTKDRVTNTQLTNNGATIINSGKIGQCYTFNGSTNLTISYPSLNTLGSNPAKFSFAFWVKLNSTWAGWGQVFTIGRNGGAWTDIRIGFDIASDKTGYFTISDGSTATSYNGPKHVLTVGIWHHVAATFDNKEMKLFINGQPASTSQATASVLPSFSSDTIIAIGGNSSEKGECDMNDVRIYDHALSQAEVKELSKALAIHYTFDDVCAEPTTNLLPVSLQNKYVENAADAASYTVTSGLTASAYTLSANIKRHIGDQSPSPYVSLFVTYSDGTSESITTSTAVDGYNIRGTADGEFHPYKITVFNTSKKTVTKVNGWILDRGSYTSGTPRYMTIQNAQLEAKDHATPYTPTSREGMLYNETGLTQPNYNANLQLTNDAGSGTYSLKCAGSTIINTPITGDITSGTTISCWIKTPTYPSANAIVFADYNSKLAFGFYGTQNAIISCGGYSAPYISNIKSNWINGWNHVVVTRNNSGTISCYLNGAKLSTTSSNNWSSTSGYSTIGGRYNGSYQTYFTGYVDDYRVYHTLLSETDILDLYKTKAYIADQGDMETHQFIEKTENVITEAGFAIPAKSTSGNGKIEMRNGVMAYGLQAATYYYSGDSESSNAIFKGKFKANTQYYFDLFMDVDTMWYSGGSKYVPGGFVLRYTDGTTVEIIATSTDGANGWKRVQFYSNPDKTIYGLGVYYYIGTKWYLRHDSGIYEMDKDNAQVTSKHTVETTQVTETSYQTNALIHSSGNIVGREIIEI